jgi:hypothetical protein
MKAATTQQHSSKAKDIGTRDRQYIKNEKRMSFMMTY